MSTCAFLCASLTSVSRPTVVVKRWSVLSHILLSASLVTSSGSSGRCPCCNATRHHKHFNTIILKSSSLARSTDELWSRRSNTFICIQDIISTTIHRIIRCENSHWFSNISIMHRESFASCWKTPNGIALINSVTNKEMVIEMSKDIHFLMCHLNNKSHSLSSEQAIWEGPKVNIHGKCQIEHSAEWWSAQACLLPPAPGSHGEPSHWWPAQLSFLPEQRDRRVNP